MKSLSKGTVFTLAALCSLIWSGAYVTGKMAVGTPDAPGFGPYRTAFFRFAVAGAILALWFLQRNPRALRIAREDWPAVFRLGLLGMCLTYVFNYVGLALSTGTAAALIMPTEPVWIALLAALFLKERLTRGRIFAIIAGLTGTILVVLSTRRPEDAASGKMDGAMLGNLLIVFSLLFESAAVLTAKRLTERYRGPVLVTYEFLTGALMLAPFAVYETWRSGPVASVGEAWGAFFYLLGPCTLFAYTMWFRLLEVADASEVTVFIFLQPVVGTLLGVLWKGDPFTTATLLGAMCVLTGMLGILRPSQPSPEREKTLKASVEAAPE